MLVSSISVLPPRLEEGDGSARGHCPGLPDTEQLLRPLNLCHTLHGCLAQRLRRHACPSFRHPDAHCFLLHVQVYLVTSSLLATCPPSFFHGRPLTPFMDRVSVMQDLKQMEAPTSCLHCSSSLSHEGVGYSALSPFPLSSSGSGRI